MALRTGKAKRPDGAAEALGFDSGQRPVDCFVVVGF